MTIKVYSGFITITLKSGVLSIGKCWIDKDKFGWIWYSHNEVAIKKFGFKNLKFF